jgi:hypothetical protein
VNVSVEPALKERVLSRLLNCAKCPICKQETEVATNLLYHDMKRETMIWLRVDKACDGELMVPRRILRIVHDYPTLVEKIRIFDTEFEDCLVEFIKFMLWPQVSGQKLEEYRGNEIRFIGVRQAPQGESLFFEVMSDSGIRHFSYPRSEAIKIAPTVAKARAASQQGRWCIVNRDFVLNLL